MLEEVSKKAEEISQVEVKLNVAMKELKKKNLSFMKAEQENQSLVKRSKTLKQDELKSPKADSRKVSKEPLN